MSESKPVDLSSVAISNTIRVFCKQFFKSEHFIIDITSLSEFNSVHKVLFKNREYIVKLSSYNNPISLIRVSDLYADYVLKFASRINRSTSTVLMVPDYLTSTTTDYGLIFLMHKNQVSPLPPSDVNLYRLGMAVGKFHKASLNIKEKGMITLPWNHFSPEFKIVLEKAGRLQEIKQFLFRHVPSKQYLYGDQLLVNHNDIHAGNIFLSDARYLFLDLNEMCLAHPFNDLGICVANYIINPQIQYVDFNDKMLEFLNGYA